MYVPSVVMTCPGFRASVEPAGTGPVMLRPGALSSGLAKPSSV